MDVADGSNVNIINGLPVLLERNISGQYVITGLPPGVFFATDDTNKRSQPSRFSFGTDHTFWYDDT